jgi:hypothetical protein
MGAVLLKFNICVLRVFCVELHCITRHTEQRLWNFQGKLSIKSTGKTISLHTPFYPSVKGTVIPVTDLDRPWGFQEFEGSQISRQPAHKSGKFVSPTHRPPLTLRKCSWYSFLLMTESAPGPQCGRKDYVNEIFEWHNRESNPRPPGL